MTPPTLLRPRLARLARAGAWTLALVSVAACTQARRKREPAPAAPPAASAPAPPAEPAPAPTPAAASAPAASAPGASAPAPLRRGLDPQRAKGKVLLQIALDKPIRMGGFGFTATYDPERFAVAEPVKTKALDGYMCQANLAQPGVIRFNCAGLLSEDRGGPLASFEIAYARQAPTLQDIVVTKTELVDDLAQAVPSGLVVTIVPPAAR